ncbi:hypothetical protein F4821DRAFT_252680 [Hypoxylon rubiginosum]|uniref:Uncharacterized protein n=1 Tax=Hypoxylon rubiginosum TaxID=110542 RepID=A0ACC0DM46_9PEZI|nr:hypothetical protein F4821DRAFT_252680 [Hypoxylon rubiginosum]
MESKSTPRAEASEERQSSLYQAIMTPINFISFILSLYLVDSHYHVKRMQEHSERYGRIPSWLLPSWLDRLLFRPQPYGWVGQKSTNGPNSAKPERWYFHTKQRKLMRLEAADAFEMRRPVILTMSVVAICAIWAFWRLSQGVLAWSSSRNS